MWVTSRLRLWAITVGVAIGIEIVLIGFAVYGTIYRPGESWVTYTGYATAAVLMLCVVSVIMRRRIHQQASVRDAQARTPDRPRPRPMTGT